MPRTRRPHGRSSGLPGFALLSVLALLAFSCVPALAQAEEAFTPQYESEVPNVPGQESSKEDEKSGGTGDSGGEDDEAKASTGSPGGGSGDGEGGSKQAGAGNTGQGSPGSEADGGQGGNGSDRADGKLAENEAAPSLAQVSSDSSDDGGSSPLVPILIAVAVLAAISIGAFYYRQRRQGSGSPVSPKAS